MNLNGTFRIATVALAALAILAMIGCGGGKKTIATVNGKDINLDDWAKLMENYQTVVGQTPQGQWVQRPVGQLALFSLISNQLEVDYAKKLGVAPTDKEISDVLEMRKRMNPQYLQSLSASNRTIEDAREDIRIALAREKVLAKSVTVTDAEIKEAYDKATKIPEPQGVLTPEKFAVKAIILNDDAKKKLADEELKRGMDFGEVSKEYSVVDSLKRTTDRGAGFLGELSYAQLAGGFGDPVAKAVQACALGQMTQWLHFRPPGSAPNSKMVWARFRMESKSDKKVRPLNDDMKHLIRSALIMQKARQTHAFADYEKNLLEFRRQSKVDIRRDPYRTSWKQFLEEEKRQTMEQKANGTGTSTTGAPPLSTGGPGK